MWAYAQTVRKQFARGRRLRDRLTIFPLGKQVLVMRDPHNHQSRGFGFITFQRDDSAKQVLQNRYHDMLGKRVEVKSAVPRGQAPPPQRGPPRSSQGYGYGQPRGGPGGAAGPGYGYSGQQYGAPQAGGAPGAYDGANPWGTLGGDAAGGQKPGYGYAGDGSKPPGGTADASSHGWTEHTAPEGYVYYYNSRTGVSQWERPMELDFPK